MRVDWRSTGESTLQARLESADFAARLLRMEVLRDDAVGIWFVKAADEEREAKAPYLDALPCYLTGLDSIFAKAMARDEAQLILSLLGIRGMQDEGWEPYDTTVDAIAAATRLHNETEDPRAARHLSLWIYGHIVEAAAPYDLLANLVKVAQGERARITWLPEERGRAISPGRKIELIGRWAEEIGNQCASYLLDGICTASFETVPSMPTTRCTAPKSA